MKTYKVKFIPIDTLDYTYTVEGKDEDDAYFKAKDSLRFSIGYDASKDFECDEIQEVGWNFTRTFMNTRLYPLPILKRLRTGTTLKNNGWLLDVKKILWN